MSQTWWKKELNWNLFPSLSRQNSTFVKDNILLQAVLIVGTGMILDGGMLLKVVMLAATGWWFGLLFILMRRPRTEKKTDQLFLKLGFVVLLPVCF